MLRYFKESLIAALAGVVLAAAVGGLTTGSWIGGIEAVFVVAVLALLEVSLSFDNAIINASVLEEMSSPWRHRFLTWGMLIAVFGMRLLFPVALVSVVGRMDPWTTLQWALLKPREYAQLMMSTHLTLVAFGGAFLMMVALDFFYDEDKTIHWVPWFEKPLVWLGRWPFIKAVLGMATLALLTWLLPGDDRRTYALAGGAGLLAYAMVRGLEHWLQKQHLRRPGVQRAGLGLFVYLEVLDASFSFDGVVGAFAITHQLLIIMIGLSVGSFFVRSFTLLLVDKKVLGRFLFLEHGAFYSIGFLALILLSQPFFEVPEWITGTLGAGVVLLALYSSHRDARRERSPERQ